MLDTFVTFFEHIIEHNFIKTWYDWFVESIETYKRWKKRANTSIVVKLQLNVKKHEKIDDISMFWWGNDAKIG